MVKLALTGNMSTGGISIDRTFEAHPENAEIAEEAARMVGLDIAGIDFICPDITQPVRETGGAICEVNAAPGFRMHTHPTIGEPQFIAKPVVDMLFPPGAPSRIPIVAVTGTNGKTTTSRMISHIFKGMGRKVGMTSTDGVVIDERLVIRADASGPRSARMVLQNPRVDFAVFEVARGGILREGLGYERNDVAVVLNVQPDHLGLRGIDTVEQLADVKAVLVEAVPRDGHAVLNADDPLVREMRRRCSGQVVWFSMAEPGSEERDMIDAHCRRGGKALVLQPTERGEMIVVRHGCAGHAARLDPPAALDVLRPCPDERAERPGRGCRRVRRRAPLHDIRQGLRTFSTNYYLSPGRLNEVEVNGVNVIVDYCHNAPGMRMLGDFVDRVGEGLDSGSELGKPSRIGVIATAGDRRDEDMRELGEVAAQHFDVVDRARGRRTCADGCRGETAALVAEGVRRAMDDGARCKQLEVILDEIEAVHHAMSRANRGDLLVVCVDKHPAGDGRAGELVTDGPGRRVRRRGRHPGRRPGLHAALGDLRLLHGLPRGLLHRLGGLLRRGLGGPAPALEPDPQLPAAAGTGDGLRLDEGLCLDQVARASRSRRCGRRTTGRCGSGGSPTRRARPSRRRRCRPCSAPWSARSGAAAAGRPWSARRGRRLAAEDLEEDELLARLHERLRRLALAHPDDPLAGLAQPRRQRGEVAVAGDDREALDVAGVEQVHRVDDQRRVGGVLAGRVGELLLRARSRWRAGAPSSR